MVAWVVVLFAIAGALIYRLSEKNPKHAELGRIVFACAFLLCMVAAAGHTIKLF
jgi:hypothetical protein